MFRYHQPVVARKHYNGVTIGFIVGWKHRHCNMVKNIRADMVFKTAAKAQQFRRNMETNRISPYIEFEILDNE